MKTLAELSFEYIWFLLFTGEDIVDLDYFVKIQESLPECVEAMSDEERAALSQVAMGAKFRLLAEPDKQGYVQRKLVTEEQRIFLDTLSSSPWPLEIDSEKRTF